MSKRNADRSEEAMISLILLFAVAVFHTGSKGNTRSRTTDMEIRFRHQGLG